MLTFVTKVTADSVVLRYCWYECLASGQRNTLVTGFDRNNPNQNVVLREVTKSIWVIANHLQLEKYPSHWLNRLNRPMIAAEDVNGEQNLFTRNESDFLSLPSTYQQLNNDWPWQAAQTEVEFPQSRRSASHPFVQPLYWIESIHTLTPLYG